jgi:hypothetical protein
MNRVLLACAVLAISAHFGGAVAARVARASGDCVALDVVQDRIPDWHSGCKVFRAPCFGLCPDLESAE